tara:strand:- start:475 stop:1425 length:951 start_codon:yes stop_codon:yes gene_type:complete
MTVYRSPIRGGITTVIQGPINDVSLYNIPQYIRNGPVIVHTWEFDLKQNRPWRLAKHYRRILSEIQEKFGDRVKIIIKPVPEEVKKIEAIHANRWDKWGEVLSRQTFHFAMYGISNALECVDTEYVLRVRSDEAYSDVDLFAEALSRDPKKFVMGNIFAAPMKHQEFHIGDHIYACKSEDLYHATNQLASFYYGYNKDPKWFYFLHPLGFEQVLAYSWLDCAGIDMSLPIRPKEIEIASAAVNNPEVKNFILSNSKQLDANDREIKKQIAHDYFHVIDINKTGNFTAQWNHRGKTYKDKFVNPHGVYNMGDMLNGY